MRKWAVVVVGVVAMVASVASNAHAAPILGCPVGADCNGTSVGAELISLGGTSYRIDVVFDFSGYRGEPTDLLHAVSIKNQAAAISNTAFAFAGAGSEPWMLMDQEMGADGCGGGSSGSRLCAQAAGLGGANVYAAGAPQTATFSFLFDAAGAVHDGVHIKHLFTYVSSGRDKPGVTGPDTLEKRGSLGSYVVPFTTDKADPSPRPIPEPAVLRCSVSACSARASRADYGREPRSSAPEPSTAVPQNHRRQRVSRIVERGQQGGDLSGLGRTIVAENGEK